MLAAFKHRLLPLLQRWSTSDQKTSIKKAHWRENDKMRVYIVGAGCGDADLLTIKAYKAILSADVILVDWLVNRDIYQHFPSDATVVFVGKKCGKHSMTQSQICNLMVKYAMQNKTVVRLKGGDPSLFGRLAEETQILSQFDIPFCIVPGVTAASGCAAYSGIPLTHRDVADSVRFVTAHKKNKDDDSWLVNVNPNETLVFYMGLHRVGTIAKRLINKGLSSMTGIAVIDQGCSKSQQVFISTLFGVQSAEIVNKMDGPALIIVGDVVNAQASIDLRLFDSLSKVSTEQLRERLV